MTNEQIPKVARAAAILVLALSVALAAWLAP